MFRHNVVVLAVDNSINRSFRGKSDKAKSPRIAGLMVIHDLTLCNIAKADEMGMQLSLPTGRGKAANKDFLSSSPRIGPDGRDALGARDGNLCFDLPAVELVELGGDALRDELVVVGDEAEAARVAGETIAHDDAVRDGPVLGKVVAQAVLVGLPRKAAHEDLLLRHGGRRGHAQRGGHAAAAVRGGNGEMGDGGVVAERCG